MDHDPLLYVTQLHELLKFVGWKQCNFVGLSLGGGILASYSHQFPETVQSLTFIAPGGLLLPSQIPWVGKIFFLPCSEDIFSHPSIKTYFSSKNIESMRAEFKDAPGGKVPEAIEAAAEILALQFKHHAGYARGLMSTLKKFPLTAMRSIYASSQDQKYPVQVIWVRDRKSGVLDLHVLKLNWLIFADFRRVVGLIGNQRYRHTWIDSGGAEGADPSHQDYKGARRHAQHCDDPP